jgi:uncharacterized protein YjiS (DUF1127 family)
LAQTPHLPLVAKAEPTVATKKMEIIMSTLATKLEGTLASAAPGSGPRAMSPARLRRYAADALRAAAASLAKRRRISRAKAELHSLSDRMLADIGVQRSHIDRIVRQGRDASEIER